MEEWKQIDEYYFVSNIGNVKSVDRIVNGRTYRGTVIKNAISRNGYVRTELRFKGCDPKKYLMHRLVAEAFIPNPDNKLTVNHINGVKDDNRVCNLEWATQSENNKHSYDSGIKKPTNQLGAKNGNARLTDLQVLEIRNIWNVGNITKMKLASIYGVSDSHICRIVNNKMRTDII